MPTITRLEESDLKSLEEAEREKATLECSDKMPETQKGNALPRQEEEAEDLQSSEAAVVEVSSSMLLDPENTTMTGWIDESLSECEPSKGLDDEPGGPEGDSFNNNINVNISTDVFITTHKEEQQPSEVKQEVIVRDNSSESSHPVLPSSSKALIRLVAPSPLLAQCPERRTITIIDIDDSDDDDRKLSTTRTVLGKRKAESEMMRNTHTGDCRIRAGTKAHQTLTNTPDISGSQHRPIELESDSDEECRPNPTSANRGHGRVGPATPVTLVTIADDSTDNICVDDSLTCPEHSSITQPMDQLESGEEEKEKEKEMEVDRVCTTPEAEIMQFQSDTPRASGSFSEQLNMYRIQHKERFNQIQVRGTSNKPTNKATSGTSGTPRISSLTPTAKCGRPTLLPDGAATSTISEVPCDLPPQVRGEDFPKWVIDTTGASPSRQSTPLEKTPMQRSSSQEGTPFELKERNPDKTKDGLDLSKGQLYVLDQVVTQRKNVFFTGSAGTGKSVLLRELIHRLRERSGTLLDPDDWDSDACSRVAVTASTGIAACNIGGCTLHSFAGVGLGQDPSPTLTAKVSHNRQASQRWRETNVLIVDEVSMIEAELLDKLEHLAKFIRNDNRPWGGIQVVLCGDFFQLPPVCTTGNAKFCFEADSWAKTIDMTIQLDQVFRQKDAAFADMLNQMRIGKMSVDTIRRFRSLSRPIQQDDGIVPTDLFPVRKQVEEANAAMLRKLEGESLVFMAKDSGKDRDKMETQCIAPTKLELKVQAQVMLLRNQNGGSSYGLVNGSVGTVIAFTTDRAANNFRVGSVGEALPPLNTPGEVLPLVRFVMEGGSTRDMVVGREEWRLELPDGKFLAGRVQIPLCLAWALSIHKSQGQTLPKVRVDVGRVFEKGQAYVALSRATTLEGLQVLNFDPKKVMVHPKVVEFYNRNV